ncbi:hypothetical protein [Streptomyces sp. NPDC057509]|uniref:hypothetical protein n=1 Tax=Streptomyces sp. NPDC057509 TaxID=3346152 RepID=UPI00368F56AC
MQETEFDWETEEFGKAHQGRPGAVLADGTEPKPVIFDVGSGPEVHETSDWWVYDGDHLSAPQATGLRGACSCGWRGTTLHPMDWPAVAADGPERYDTTGPEADWNRHITDVEAHTTPIPEDVAALLTQLRTRLDTLALDAPLAALRIVSALEYPVGEAARTAAYTARSDDRPWDAIATALGLTEAEARTRIHRYARP